jgi:beta-mannosidase
MFRSWSREVKALLIPGTNELRVIFESPIEHNRKWIEGFPHRLPSGNEADSIEIKASAFTRKAAYHFGWDWGPRFVTSGIWRPVKLVSWNQARIKDFYITTLNISDSLAVMQAEIEIEVSNPGTYFLDIGEERIERSLSAGDQNIIHSFCVENPKLWWANGSGNSHLYDVDIALSGDGILLDSLSKSYGVRTIELVNEPDSIGTSFYFKLNGEPLFMKGANYVPQDVFLPRVSQDQYEDLILAAKDAGMNMLRVWGGGIYENDIFYNLCDQHGILVWQDFMFANSLYPDDEDFEKNVGQEVIENIKRLRSHPCLAIWCGNNEIEVAWKNWGWQKQYGYSEQDSIEIWENYKSIFHELIPGLVESLSPEIPYTPTSPLSNWGKAENFNHSSMHYWGVWHGREPFERFEHNVGRFMVEYGFQSFPNISTLRKVATDSSLYLNSMVMQSRQKSYIGNGLILENIEQYYKSPENFEDFVQLSQKVQAKGLGMAIEAHMKAQPYCMGTLFWQFNDCWPGPSWSVVDYYGEKKEGYFVVSEVR